MHTRLRSILTASALSLCVTAVLGTYQAQAQVQQAQASYGFDLPAQPMADALRAIAQQTGTNVLFESKDMEGLTAPALKATLTASEAVVQVLAGTGLSVEQTTPVTMVVRRLPVGGSVSPQPVSDGPGRQAIEPEASLEEVSGGRQAAGAGGTTLDTVTVTGTRIKGGTTASPIVSIGSERIAEEGFSDLGEVVRSIPQNFSGGQNPGVINGTASTNANQNTTGGSGLNLRGLGPDATLTLLNGRRMSYSGYLQAVDISAIPVEAVDRLEVVPDGASAIYGSDAVGGVGNVILKRDYQGLTVGTRYGKATDGGLNTREYTATAGVNWSTGGVIAAWKDTSGDPIYADQRQYTKNMYYPATIYAGNSLHGGLISGHQTLGDSVELQLDVLRTVRDKDHYYGYSAYYIRDMRRTKTSLFSPSIKFSLSNDWTLTVGSAWGDDESVNDSRNVRATGESRSSTLYNNKSRTYDVGAEGPLFSVYGGDARLAVGVGYRSNEFQQRDVINGTESADGADSSRFAYAELSLPFISPDSNISGVHRFDVSAAVRSEDYDSFGRVSTPKFGLIYGPISDVTLKVSWGKSFKAPTLLQRYGTYYTYLYPAESLGGVGYTSDATVLMTYGGNPDLKAERARTLSASLEFQPEAIPGLWAELTWFDIDYTDRVVLPIAGATEALSNSIYEQFVSYYPTAEAQEDALADSKFSNWSGTDYDSAKVIAIATNRYMNAARQQIKVLDLSGSYKFDVGQGRLVARGSVSWLKSTQQTTSAESEYDLSGTLFNPAKLSGRIGSVWSQGGFTASSFVNYIGGVTNTTDDKKTASFTTIDTTFRYEAGVGNDVLSGLAFELSVQNLFNREPPLYIPTSADAARYDSTNYSAIGRFVRFSVSKHF